MLKRLFLIAALALAPLAARADGTIDSLTSGGALAGTELLPMFQTANPAVTTTPSAISTYVNAHLPTASSSVFGIAECDNSTITCAGGVFSAVSGGSGNVVSPGSGFTAGHLIEANNSAGTAILDAGLVATNVITSTATQTSNAFPFGGGSKTLGGVIGPPSSGLGVLAGWSTGNTPAQIVLGTNLTMTGSTLNATGGGSSAFSALTSGTNTTMAGVIGSGASITLSGSGVNVANQVPAALGTGIVCSTAGPLSVSAGCPIIPTAISTSTVALVAANAGQLVLATNASPTTFTLAQSTGSLGTGFGLDFFTEGQASTGTITTSTLNGQHTIKMGAFQNMSIAADGAGNYVGSASVPWPPAQTHATCLFDDFVWAACSGSGTLTASGSITNGSLGIWASGTSLSGTVVPGTGVLTFLATPSSANLAAAVTGETGTGALVFGTSPTIASPAFSGTSTGTYTLGGTLTLGNGAVATTQTTGDNTTKVATDAFVIANAGGGTVTNLTLAPGFTTTIGTQNTAGQNITTTGTINGQLWPEPQTVNYTVLTSDTGALPLANGSGSITFTLPNPATGTKGATYQFNDESGHGYTMATVGATADFLGCSGGGSTTLAVPASTGVSVVDNGTSYSCLLYGGGGSGSGTVNSGTSTHLAYYASSTNAVSSNTHLLENGSQEIANYATGGAAALAAQTGTALQLVGANATAAREEIDSYGSQAFFTGVCSSGTIASPTALTANTQCGGYNSYMRNDSGIVGPLASIRTFAAENQVASGTHGGSYVEIATTPNGSQTMASIIRFENDGGITQPSTVTGGDKGAGSYNDTGGFFVNGQDTRIPAVPTPGTSITLAAPSGFAICTGTCTVTVPIPAAGYQFCVYNDVAVATAITISNPGSGTRFSQPQAAGTATAYGTASSGTLASTAANGNAICIVGRDNTHYISSPGSAQGTWTAS